MIKTWEEATKAEPRLKELYIKAKNYKGNCANRYWYLELKPEFLKLVGWDARNPKLDDEKLYDICYKKIYDILPDCSHQGCC